MLSLHFADRESSNRFGVTPKALNRAVWMEWVRKSHRSQTDLIEQCDIDPDIEQHMILARAIPGTKTTVTTTVTPKTNMTKESVPGKSSHSHLPEQQISERRPGHRKSKDDAKGTEKPRELYRAKRKEMAQSNSGDEKTDVLPSGQGLVRVTTSMVLQYQEGIWQCHQLERQAHLPPPANHQKRRFIQDDVSEPSLDDAVEEFHCTKQQQEQEMACSRRGAKCPVCHASAHLAIAEAIFQCKTCGAFASYDLMQSLAQDHV
jgi:hypothetical protein